MLPPPNRSTTVERLFYSSWLGAELCRLAQIIRTLMKTQARIKQVESYLQRDISSPPEKNGAGPQDQASRLQQLKSRVRELEYNLGKVDSPMITQ
jgi:hypothetical protein